MLTPTYTGAFKKGRKLMRKRGNDIDELTYVMSLLASEQPLPPKYKNHSLRGKWTGCEECHVGPDWLLIYAVDRTARKIVFHSTGTHAASNSETVAALEDVENGRNLSSVLAYGF